MDILSPVLFASCSQSRYFLLFIAISVNIPIPIPMPQPQPQSQFYFLCSQPQSQYFFILIPASRITRITFTTRIPIAATIPT